VLAVALSLLQNRAYGPRTRLLVNLISCAGVSRRTFSLRALTFPQYYWESAFSRRNSSSVMNSREKTTLSNLTSSTPTSLQ